MEKLQVALDKARQARNDADARMAPAPASAQTGAKTGAKTGDAPLSHIDALWQALPEFRTDAERLDSRRIVTQTAGNAATPFDILRTKVLLQMRAQGWKRLAITSPMPQSGKSTTACNLALGLGRARDMRTMLFDLDLREPSIHAFFDVMPPYGIGNLLSGQVSFAEQGMRLGDSVAVSMARGAVADPTRLLLDDQAAAALDRIEADYAPDLMIFDLPSVLVNDDARAFLKNVDCALIVVRADRTHYSQFNTCEREIAEQTNVLGVVLNAYRHDARHKRD